MRVLHVIPSLSTRTGGPPVAVVQSALALRDCGIESTIVATDMGAAASAAHGRRVAAADLPDGADHLDVRLFPAMPPGRLAFSPSLYRAIERTARDYDVVHIHSLFLFPQFAAATIAQRHSIPYVVSPRGALDPHLRRRNAAVKAIADVLWQRRALERAAAIHLTSDEEAIQIADISPRTPRAIVPNGVRCAGFERLPNPAAFRRRWRRGSDAPVVMFMGRIAAKKGVDLLIRAFAAARRDADDAWLAIVGPDDEGLTPSLLALAAREGVADRVVFTGMLNGADKLAALAAADVWALPSHGENFGNAVVEAMAASRAVIVAPGVNIAPQIAAARAGIVAERTVEGFADVVARLLRDANERVVLGNAARDFARRYDWARVAPQLADMYASVVLRKAVAA